MIQKLAWRRKAIVQPKKIELSKKCCKICGSQVDTILYTKWWDENNGTCCKLLHYLNFITIFLQINYYMWYEMI